MDYTRDEYRDPITGAPGAHPIGTGVGAAGGGAGGAAVGTAVAGPVGTLVGAAIGAVIGGLAGKGVAEMVDPTGEDEYWRENYRDRPYVDGEPYDTYRPAYAYGWETRRRNLDATWEEAEPELEHGWERLDDRVELGWDRAKLAARDGWERVEAGFERLFTDEDDYWRENYQGHPYVAAGEPYETYRPAYRYGARSRVQHLDSGWEDVESDLERGWERFKGQSRLTWHQAKDAVRDGWHHVERALPGDFDRDGR
jgi:hypothetical protein